MKRTVLQLVVVLSLVGSVRADQTIQSVQQALTDQGFYYGNVTGDKSAETSAAIRRYQIRNGLQVNGEINSETLRSLNVNSNSASSPRVLSASSVAQPAPSRPDYNSQVALDSSPRSLGEFGRRVEISRALVGGVNASASGEMHVHIVAEVQRQLRSQGYYRGWIDGRYGRGTAFAVRVFQSRSGISPTGRLDIRTLEALGLPGENLAYLESAPWRYVSRVWVRKEFKHGKWKVKWQKHHGGDDGDEYADEDEQGNGDGHWHGHGHGDDD
jgi:peptidoglycan hydrolase-like protein with peptidoglycan-binding domain